MSGVSPSRIVLRSMSSRLLSTVITVLTVAVAVSLMLLLLGLRDAARDSLSRGTGNMHLLVSRDASPLDAVLNGIFYASPPRAAFPMAKFDQLSSSFPFEWAVPTQLGDSYRGLRVLATTDAYFDHFEPVMGEPWVVAEGRIFEDTFDLVLGSEAARLTGLGLGDTAVLTHGFSDHEDHEGHVHDEYTFTVTGILAPSGTLHDRALFKTLEATWVVHAHDNRKLRADGPIELTKVEDLTDRERLITGMYARVFSRPGRDSSAAIQQVFDRLRADPTVTVAQPAQQLRRLFSVVGNIEGVLLVMALVVLVSSGLGIMLALYNSMAQRRRQIAVLRVLGASRGKVFELVLTESLVIGLVGAMLGLAGAVVGAGLVGGVFSARVGLDLTPVVLTPVGVYVALGAVVLSGLAGLIPALMAYRTSVHRNLRPMA
ncbi:MAG: ABC transporter permease [Planctomycetota bacterium]